MSRQTKKADIIHSIEEFKKIYLPRQSKVKIIETHSEARDFGINLADESVKKLRIRAMK